MFAIQWFDPYDKTKSGKARKDGPPRGKFETKELAELAAEQGIEEFGAFEVTYKIVNIPERKQ